jgi:hypothetical protein
MAKSKKQRKQNPINLGGLESLLKELREFCQEFYLDDPSETSINLDVHISTLIEKKIIKKHWWRRQPKLKDVFETLLGDHSTDSMLERVDMFGDLINDYRGEPSTEDMEQAKDILEKLIQELEGFIQSKKAPNESPA